MSYAWSVDAFPSGSADLKVFSSLEKGGIWVDRGHHGRFRFENYLGSAWIAVEPQPGNRKQFWFEVASPKLDFDSEYRELVESIAAECQALLLDWRSPTSLTVESDQRQEASTLIERFLFLRHALNTEGVQEAIEEIQRNPHQSLRTEREWKSVFSANASNAARDPIRCARDWFRQGKDGFPAPSEIVVDRRYESHDTTPNRFAKHALRTFLNVCTDCAAAASAENNGQREHDPLLTEIRDLQSTVESLLDAPFFAGVGELSRIPLENTVIRQRAGYRELLLAWNLVSAATRLHWDGIDDVYQGGSRDVATLYEYWLYITLFRRLNSDSRFTLDRSILTQEESQPFFVERDKGQVGMQLRKGEASFVCFNYESAHGPLRVHFFYNRSFGRKAIGTRGTYSTTLRPDFTFVILPAPRAAISWHEAELRAEIEGSIAYLHFDAKYRGENLSDVFGDPSQELEKTPPHRVKTDDLYKMHTYNDAIRRTAGAYVIFPGVVAAGSRAPSRFQRYHELVPGIGAFGVRPGSQIDAPEGLADLVGFICDVIEHHADRFTQHSATSRAVNAVTREAPRIVSPARAPSVRVPVPSARILLAPLAPRDDVRWRARLSHGAPLFALELETGARDDKALVLSSAAGLFLCGCTTTDRGAIVSTEWFARIEEFSIASASEAARLTGETFHADGSVLLLKIEPLFRVDARDVSGLFGSSTSVSDDRALRTLSVTAAEFFAQPPFDVGDE